jgi:hypothetical protein
MNDESSIWLRVSQGRRAALACSPCRAWVTRSRRLPSTANLDSPIVVGRVSTAHRRLLTSCPENKTVKARGSRAARQRRPTASNEPPLRRRTRPRHPGVQAQKPAVDGRQKKRPDVRRYRQRPIALFSATIRSPWGTTAPSRPLQRSRCHGDEPYCHGGRELQHHGGVDDSTLVDGSTR